MNAWIIMGCVGVFLFVWLIVFLFSLAMARAAAPRNAEERAREDYEQMKALGYFDNTVTSGSPVMHK